MYFICATSIFIFALYANSVMAAVWLFDPTISLGQAYDDNFRLTSNSSQEDEVGTTNLSGELAIKGKSERLDVKTLLRLDAINYSGDNSDLDDKNNQSLRLTSAYKATERNGFSLKGDFFRDTIVRTTRSIFDPLPDDGISFDPDQDVDVNLVRDDARRERFKISPGWSYRLNESTSLGLQYTYFDLSFSGDDNANLVESETQRISANISRRMTEKDKVRVSISESYFRPDDVGADRDVDTIEARLGWIHKFTESFEMDFVLGIRDSDFENSQKSSDSGFVGEIGATKRTGLTTYRVNIQRRENPSSSGNQVEVDEINVNIRRKITEKLTFSFDGRFFDTETTNSTNSNSNREYISLEPRLSWRFLPSWKIGAGYKYSEEDLDDGGSGDSNAAFIKISWSPPRQF
jgi:hypothetical protein